MMTAALPSVPMMKTNTDGPVERLNTFLDQHVLPYPVKYLTNRVTILGTLCLLVPLILFANVVVFVVAGNSYLNVMCVVVSSTVLLYSTLADSRDRLAAQRREEIAVKHEAMVDARAQADHQKIEEIHIHLDKLDKEMQEHVNSPLDNIQKILTDHLEKIQTEDHAPIPHTHKPAIRTLP